MAKLLGLSLNGIVCAMITRAPEKSPDAPIPAIALPMMSTVDEGEVAQTKDPISKIPRNVRYDHLREK